jgi:hypothetical protein
MEGDVRARAGIICLDPAADPKALDFTATEGPQEGGIAGASTEWTGTP